MNLLFIGGGLCFAPSPRLHFVAALPHPYENIAAIVSSACGLVDAVNVFVTLSL